MIAGTVARGLDQAAERAITVLDAVVKVSLTGSDVLGRVADYAAWLRSALRSLP